MEPTNHSIFSRRFPSTCLISLCRLPPDLLDFLLRPEFGFAEMPTGSRVPESGKAFFQFAEGCDDGVRASFVVWGFVQFALKMQGDLTRDGSPHCVASLFICSVVASMFLKVSRMLPVPVWLPRPKRIILDSRSRVSRTPNSCSGSSGRGVRLSAATDLGDRLPDTRRPR